jgi:hypothetical protein
MRRREVVALAAAIVWLVGVGAATWFLGTAGWRGGWAIAIIVNAGGATIVCAALLRGSGASWLWLIAIGVLGLIAAARLIDDAPLSKARLATDLDQFRLPFYTLLSDRRSGHSWCRPTCPTVRRVYRAPLTSLSLPKDTVAASASYLHLLPDLRAVLEARNASGFSAQSERATIIESAVRGQGALIVTVELRSHRGNIRHPRPAVTQR